MPSGHNTRSAPAELAVKHRAVTLFLIIAILAAGFFSLGKLGRAEDPLLTVKVMTITAWPWAFAWGWWARC